MKKIHNYFVIFMGSFILLCTLIAFLMMYNIRSNSIRSLALESMTLLAHWKELVNRTDGLLLDRYTYFGPGDPPELIHWEQSYKSFGQSLEDLIDNPSVLRQTEMLERLEGAYRVWRFTEVQLNNAKHYFSRIIQSGLGRKIMVNGMLHTMYQMRIQGQLTVQEIYLVEEAIYALESLQHATREFDAHFNAIVFDMEQAGNIYLARVRMLFFALFGAATAIFLLFMLLNNQLKLIQHNRKQYLEGSRREVLKSICDDSSVEAIAACREQKEELDISLSLEQSILVLAMQIDGYHDFSHTYNTHEQKEMIDRLRKTAEEFFRACRMPSDSYCYRDDLILFLLNHDDTESSETIIHTISSWFKENSALFPIQVTLTIGDFCYEIQDLDKDIKSTLQLAEYRYLMGTGSVITFGAWAPHPAESFRYPLEKERLFEEAFRSLDFGRTQKILKEMIDYAQPYGPDSMKRLLLRLAAAQSAVVEQLEKSFSISVLENFTPMVLDVQRAETLDDAYKRMIQVIERVTGECLHRKQAKHDQTTIRIKEIIEEKLLDLNLSADSIADHFGLTSSYINRLFKQQTGMSIAGHINEVRLQKADQLLEESHLTVSQVAAQSGFSSMGTFFRLFKKRYGLTPKERMQRKPQDQR